MKTLKTILLISSFLFSGILWLTREEYLESLSAFALSKNALYYRAMHISTILFFMVNAISYKKYATEFALAGGMSLILIFDMYNHNVLHSIFTISTVLLACLTLVINSKLNKRLSWILVIGACTTFSIGYFTSMHFLLAEVITMAILASGKLLEIYKK